MGVFAFRSGLYREAANVEAVGAGVELAEVLRRWKTQGVVGLVWGNAAFQHLKAVGRRIYQPPHSLEVNPVERVKGGSMVREGEERMGTQRRKRRR